MLYLDNCATTKPHQEVIDTIAEVMRAHYGNPSSLHHLGLDAERLLHRAREVIASTVGGDPSEIIFTSGGTESNNLALKGAVKKYRHRGNHIITSAIEHSSVYDTAQQLQKEGFEVTFLPVDETGWVSPESVASAMKDNTILVSIMHVNNEMGRIQSIEQIGDLLKQYPKVLFHVDAIQSIGKLPVEPVRWGIDLLSASAHKLHGPKGVGFLYKRNSVELEPLLIGGGQEFGIRPGTENVPLIVGMAKAMRMAAQERASNCSKLYRLRHRLIERMKGMPSLAVNGSERMDDMAPQLVHFSLPGLKAEVVIHALEQHQVYVSTRSACSSGANEPSRVLSAMGFGPARAASGVRVSYTPYHTEADMDAFADRLEHVIKQLT